MKQRSHIQYRITQLDKSLSVKRGLPVLKPLALISALGVAGSAMASYQAHAPGPLMTYGKSTHPSTILSIANNPASAHALLSQGEKHRMGYFSSLGVLLMCIPLQLRAGGETRRK